MTVLAEFGSGFTVSLKYFGGFTRGALRSLEIAYEIFPEQKDLCGFLKDFS